MPRPLHWITLQEGHDWPGAGGANIFSQSADLPAGATLKKVLANSFNYGGITNVGDTTGISPWFCVQAVSIVGGPHDGRVIHQAEQRIPHVVYSHSSPLESFFHQILYTGDNDLAFNFEANYGKHSDLEAWAVHVDMGVFPATILDQNPNAVAGHLSAQVKVLYEY